MPSLSAGVLKFSFSSNWLIQSFRFDASFDLVRVESFTSPKSTHRQRVFHNTHLQITLRSLQILKLARGRPILTSFFLLAPTSNSPINASNRDHTKSSQGDILWPTVSSPSLFLGSLLFLFLTRSADHCNASLVEIQAISCDFFSNNFILSAFETWRSMSPARVLKAFIKMCLNVSTRPHSSAMSRAPFATHAIFSIPPSETSFQQVGPPSTWSVAQLTALSYKTLRYSMSRVFTVESSSSDIYTTQSVLTSKSRHQNQNFFPQPSSPAIKFKFSSNQALQRLSSSPTMFKFSGHHVHALQQPRSSSPTTKLSSNRLLHQPFSPVVKLSSKHLSQQ